MTSVLKIETQDLDNRQVQLTVEVPGSQLQQAMRSAARGLGRHTHFPGFRPGKAPYDLIVRRFGEEVVFEEALDTLGQEVYRQALENSKLVPYAPGTLDEVVSRQPLVLRYTVPLHPEVELGDYRSLRIPFEKPEVSDEAVDALMEDLRQSQAILEPADRPAQMSDVVILDVVGERLEPEEGEQATLLDQKGVTVLVDDQTDWPIPGIAEHLVGLEAGAKKTLNTTFPDDYPSESLRGRKARFDITCLEVKSRLVPRWSDRLARNLGEFEDLLDLRIKVRKSLEARAFEQADLEYEDRLVDEVVKASSVRYPPIMLEEEVNDLLREFTLRLATENLSLQDYLTIKHTSESDLRQELKPRADDRLKRSLVLLRLVEAEGLEVEQEEIDDKIKQMTSTLQDSEGKLQKTFETSAGRRQIELTLLTDKVRERLKEIASGKSDPTQPTEPQLAPVSETTAGSPSQPEVEESIQGSTEFSESGSSSEDD